MSLKESIFSNSSRLLVSLSWLVTMYFTDLGIRSSRAAIDEARRAGLLTRTCVNETGSAA
jgi:hypothetical protein